MIRTHRELLASRITREPSFSELYLAHFLGATGATRLFALLSDKPQGSAADAFPAAAKANPDIFFKTVRYLERIAVARRALDRKTAEPARATAGQPQQKSALAGKAAQPAKPTAIDQPRKGAPASSAVASKPASASPAVVIVERPTVRIEARSVAEVKSAFASMIDRRVARYTSVREVVADAAATLAAR